MVFELSGPNQVAAGDDEKNTSLGGMYAPVMYYIFWKSKRTRYLHTNKQK